MIDILGERAYRLRGQRADASTGHAEAFAADSCFDLLVFLLDMNNAPFVIDSVFISLSLIKGAYHGRCGFFMGVFCNRPYDYWIISFPLAPAKSFLNRFAYGI